MNSQQAWEEEYAHKRLMTGDKPAKSLIKWIKQLRKEGIDFSTVRVLDLGSGEGKNALYLANMGSQVECIEIARNAVETTKKRAREAFWAIVSRFNKVQLEKPLIYPTTVVIL